MKVYVAAAAAEALKKRQDETQFTTKIDGFLSSSRSSGGAQEKEKTG
jgi:hypothetical protein